MACTALAGSAAPLFATIVGRRFGHHRMSIPWKHAMRGTAAPADLERILRERFGLAQFRGRQAEVITRVLAGRDTLALMPTGAGKSLCYQLPAVLLDGVTLVISPLVALMRDQERRLARLGIAGRALEAGQSAAERSQIAHLLQHGCLEVLLLSPERLLAPGFLPWLARLCGQHPVRLLVVDEAHCIVEWGRDFRPVYRRLGELRRWFPGIPVLAMTASADHATQAEVLQRLGMPQDALLRAGFDRPELYYRVAHTAAPARSALAYLQAHHASASAICYCRRRWQTAVLAAFLQAHGVAARAYHAGLSAEARRHCEDWFLNTPGAVVVATIAFGMGIDKADVRLVVHIGAANSLSAYYQESGRAGRDGLVADALLLLPWHDQAGAGDGAGAGADREDGAQRACMAAYIEARGCRRAALLSAFDEACVIPCSGCDHCRPDWHPLPPLRNSRLPWVPPARPHASRNGTRLRESQPDQGNRR